MNKLRTTELLLAHVNSVIAYDLPLVAIDHLVTLQKTYHDHIKSAQILDANPQFLNGIHELNDLIKDMGNNEVYLSISKVLDGMRESEFYANSLNTNIPFTMDLIQQLALALDIERNEKYYDTETFISAGETIMDNLDTLYDAYGLPLVSVFTRDIFSEFMHKSPIYQISIVLLNLRELIALALPQQKSEMTDDIRDTIKETLASVNLFLLEAIDIDTLGKANERMMALLVDELIHLVYWTLEELTEGLYTNRVISHRLYRIYSFTDIAEAMDVISFISENVFVDNKVPHSMIVLQNAIDDAFSRLTSLSSKYYTKNVDFGILSGTLKLIDTITATLYDIRMVDIRQSVDKTDRYWIYNLLLEDKSLQDEPNNDAPQNQYDAYIESLKHVMVDKEQEYPEDEMTDIVYTIIKQICKSGK